MKSLVKDMINCTIIPLQEFLKKYSKTFYNQIIKSFVCSRNHELEKFLAVDAIVFEESHISRTYLIINLDFKNNKKSILAGYFTLSANRVIDVSKVSKTCKKKYFCGIANYEEKENEGVFLIGQLARNDDFSNMELPGEIIFKEIYRIFIEVFDKVGGRVIMVECEDNIKNIYLKQGFTWIGVNETNNLNTFLRRTDKIEE